MTLALIPRRRRIAAGLLAVIGLLLAACSAPTTGPTTGQETPDPGTGHLHGLGVDPADNTVYAAGHYGVFRITDGKAVRVADHYQDTMGFAVIGPSTFLGSGHPSPTDPDARSPHLGLIRSTDAGRTWQTISAEGEADFHALQQAGEVLYGYDSQSEKVWASSDDGRTWDRRAQLSLLDLAAHAESPEKVWAATGEGLSVSTDGGRTFRAVPGAPALVAVDEPRHGLLVGLAADGRVVVGRGGKDGQDGRDSQDGQEWTEQGRLPGDGDPAVLTAVTADRLLAADSAAGIYESTDAGRTWTVLLKPSAA